MKIDKKLHKMILTEGGKHSPFNSERENYDMFMNVINDYDTFVFLAKHLISFDEKYHVTFRHFYSNYFTYLAAKKVGFDIDSVKFRDYGWVDSDCYLELIYKYEYGIINSISLYKSKNGEYYTGGYMYNTQNNGAGATPANNIYGNVYSSEEECFVATAQEYLNRFDNKDKIKSKIKEFLLNIYFEKTGKMVFPFDIKVGSQLLIF
jgi:hypothetical protein